MAMSAFISLEQVHWRQKRLKIELQKLGEEISDDFATLTAPPAGDGNVMETFMSTATRAWWLFDGVLTGYKLFRRLSGFAGFFGKRKLRR